GAVVLMRATILNQDVLDPLVRESFEALTGRINTVFLKQHTGDGLHTAITATSLTTTGAIMSGSLITGQSSLAVTGAITASGGITSTGAFVQAKTGFFERDRNVALGEWTAVSFASGNFTASSGNWTLTSGDQLLFRYMLIGKTLFIKFRLDTTTVSATPTNLRITLPGGFTVAQDGFAGGLVYNDNGAGWNGGGHIYTTSGQTYVELYKSDLSNWATATDTTYVRGQVQVEI